MANIRTPIIYNSKNCHSDIKVSSDGSSLLSDLQDSNRRSKSKYNEGLENLKESRADLEQTENLQDM